MPIPGLLQWEDGLGFVSGFAGPIGRRVSGQEGPQQAPAAPGTTPPIFASLTSDQINNALADYPLFLSTHAASLAKLDPAFAAWWSTTGSFLSGQNQADPNFPAYRLYDFQFNKFSQPLAQAASTWYVLLNFGATLQAFDAVVILGHNFGAVGGLTVQLQVASTADFATGLVTLSSWTPTTHSKRLVSLNMVNGANSQQLVSGVQYARLVISGPSNFMPQIGDIVLSTRRQLYAGGLLPYDPDAQASSFTDFRPKNAATTRYSNYVGQAVLDMDVWALGATQWGPVTGWWADIVRGQNPFGFVEHPNSLPNNCLWMFDDTASPSGGKSAGGDLGFSFPYNSDQLRRYKLSMFEQGAPLFSAET